ncbi:MAG: hypothetical protein ABII94_02780 [Patescibacteria group bacterium]
MTQKNIINVIKKYQGYSDKKRREFLNSFEKKMIYRTTKTENPQTTYKMVEDVLEKLNKPQSIK